METFNEYFGSLITHCKDTALEELRTNKNYIGLKNTQDDLRTVLEAAISGEAKEIFEQFLEAAISVRAMECNITLMRGLTLPAEIQRLYDASTAEYKSFENEYL
jgi:hypothetical protein